MVVNEYLYSVLIKLGDELPEEIKKYIEDFLLNKAFNNEYGKLENLSTEENIFAFCGNEDFFVCLNEGLVLIKNNDEVLDNLEGCLFIDNSPSNESYNALEELKILREEDRTGKRIKRAWEYNQPKKPKYLYTIKLKLKKGLDKETLNHVTEFINNAFDNKYGKALNDSKKPLEFIFNGNEDLFHCLTTGMLHFNDDPLVLESIEKGWHIDREDESENYDILEELKIIREKYGS